MKKNKLFIFVIIACCLCILTGCIYNDSDKGVNNINNNVTNEITQTVVDYNSNVTIEDLEDAICVTTKMVEPAVIGVTLKKVTNTILGGKKYSFEDTESIGSGVIYKRIDNVKEDGALNSYTYYVITNAHVILSEDTKSEHVVYAYLGAYNTEIKADILGYDEKIDLAVIKFDSYYLINPVEFQDVTKLEKGNFVVAVGNPDGYDYYGSVTFGVISNLGRYISFDTDNDGTNDYMGEYIQTDAAINPGNSGGGLFTLDGKLIGINSIKLASETIDNMGFAIPINIVKIAVEEYLEKGLEIVRPRLGVMIVAVRDMTSDFMISEGITSFPNIYGDEKPYGIYISEFTSSGLLVNQGLHTGDIILTFDGVKLYESNQISGFLNSLDEYRVGSVVEISYYCCKSKTVETKQITLKIGE